MITATGGRIRDRVHAPDRGRVRAVERSHVPERAEGRNRVCEPVEDRNRVREPVQDRNHVRGHAEDRNRAPAADQGHVREGVPASVIAAAKVRAPVVLAREDAQDRRRLRAAVHAPKDGDRTSDRVRNHRNHRGTVKVDGNEADPRS